MRRLRDTVAVNCPVDRALARIEWFFAARRGADGKLRIPLRVPLGRTATNAFAADHEVLVDARVARDDQNLNELVRVEWKSEGEVPLPPFVGTLAAWGEGNPNLTFIELDGTYAPPLGVAGETFDEAFGRRIAQHTAKDLLAEIAEAIADGPPVTDALEG